MVELEAVKVRLFIVESFVIIESFCTYLARRREARSPKNSVSISVRPRNARSARIRNASARIRNTRSALLVN